MNGLLGRKIEMTQVFDGQGRLVAVTLIKAGPCVVTAVRTPEKDGYSAVQLGLVERTSRSKVSKAVKTICEKAEVAPLRTFAEFRLGSGQAAPDRGSKFDASLFSPGDYVDVTGRTKGHGFQGVIRRHGFRGGAATHGSMFHRAPGSIGSSAFPSRVFKGMRMGGHMGDVKVTTKNLRVVHVDAENNLIAVAGAVPGGRNGLVRLRRGYRKAEAAKAEAGQAVAGKKKG